MTTRKADRPLYGMFSDERKLEIAIGNLQSASKSEGLEATTVEGAIEMLAWDLGYQNYAIPDWLTYLGKQFKIPVKKEHTDGRKAAFWARGGK